MPNDDDFHGKYNEILDEYHVEIRKTIETVEKTDAAFIDEENQPSRANSNPDKRQMIREELEAEFVRDTAIKAGVEASQLAKEGQPEIAPTLSFERVSLDGLVRVRPESRNADV